MSAAEQDTVPANNTDTEPTAVTPRIDLAITKSDAPDPVVADGQLTYTLNVVNNGPSDATGVTVVDTLPAGVSVVSRTASQGTLADGAGSVTASLGNLAAGGTATVTIVVDLSPTTQGPLTNTAVVSGTEQETNQANNTASATTQVSPRIDLAITKSDSPDPVVAGQSLTYTLVVTNSGPSAATGVTVTDTLPAGVTFQNASSTQGSASHASGTVSASIGNLASGATATVTIAVGVARRPPER